MPIPTYSIFVPNNVVPKNTVFLDKPASPFPIDDDMHLYTLVLLPIDQRPPCQRYGLFFVEDYETRTDTWIMRPVVKRRSAAPNAPRRRATDTVHDPASAAHSYALAPRAIGYSVGRVYAYSGALSVAPIITTMDGTNLENGGRRKTS